MLVAVAGCAPTVSVAEAPYGHAPECARVVLALPPELGGLPQLATSSQASTAWGTATAPIVLRCGVEPPGPTTDRCVTVETPGGPSVDWLAVPADDEVDPGAAADAPEGAEAPDAPSDGVTGGGTVGATDWTFTTYGREPAIEVVVPAEVVSERSTSFLDQLGPAVDLLAPERTCLGLTG
ncbi:DUF3515 family protein [Cellulomonas cellasea]|uniref:Uncharacterized protein n=1 Tax=Cellulomonas cellasea TaxID=43670 RepID=A0A7W4UBM2_9CELL|nr:DUF3515 family protein [Cellulomonas cellasea]MBB2921208.1 hypothetical protein [Cellulomonas cellasea]